MPDKPISAVPLLPNPSPQASLPAVDPGTNPRGNFRVDSDGLRAMLGTGERTAATVLHGDGVYRALPQAAVASRLQMSAAPPTYLHRQTQPATTWTIAHGLGRHPGAVVLDTAGNRIYPGGESYPDTNTLVLTFSAPFPGTADLI